MKKFPFTFPASICPSKPSSQTKEPRYHAYSAFLALLFFLFGNHLSAQDEFKVSYVVLHDTLSASDEFDRELGRFDVFEFDLATGDEFDIEVVAHGFQPALILVPPEEEAILQMPEGIAQTVRFRSIVTDEGTWLILVRGDSTATGRYELKCRWTAASSRQLSREADLCTQLRFLLAHLKADFYFIKKAALPGQIQDQWEPTVTLESALDAKIIHPGAEKYVATLYEGNDSTRAEQIFNTMLGKIRFCLEDNWEMHNETWRIMNALSPYRQKAAVFTEKGETAYRFIRITLTDYSNTPNLRPYDYSVGIIFDRK